MNEQPGPHSSNLNTFELFCFFGGSFSEIDSLAIITSFELLEGLQRSAHTQKDNVL
jgi:hypothetical protein